MLVPGADFPHLCAQCEDYPCVEACPFKALSVSKKTSAVLVNDDKCTGCGKCIDACPGRIPHMHRSIDRKLRQLPVQFGHTEYLFNLFPNPLVIGNGIGSARKEKSLKELERRCTSGRTPESTALCLRTMEYDRGY